MTSEFLLDYLFKKTINMQDPFIAAACYPYLDNNKHIFEDILFATSKLRRKFASVHFTPSAVLNALAEVGNQLIRIKISKHINTSAETLVCLAEKDDSIEISRYIVANKNTPTAILINIFDKHGKSSKIRNTLCFNPNTPLILLKKIVNNATINELKGIANNNNTDASLLKLLWSKEDIYLKAAVIVNQNCPQELFQLAKNMSETVIRCNLPNNPNLQDNDLLDLLKDEKVQVRVAALKTIPIAVNFDNYYFDKSPKVRRNQARHTKLPLSWIQHLAKDDEPWVRRLIARNKNTPEQVLQNLANDKEVMVRRGVARNPKCSIELMHQLAFDKHSWVRAGVALRTDVPDILLNELAKDTDIDILSALGRNPKTSPLILDRIISHTDKDVRRSVILNNFAPRSILRKSLTDPYPLNRILLTNNKNLLIEDTLNLIKDPEPAVRFSSAKATIRIAFA